MADYLLPAEVRVTVKSLQPLCKSCIRFRPRYALALLDLRRGSAGVCGQFTHRSHVIDPNGAVHWPRSCERGGPYPRWRTRSHLIGLFVAIRFSVLVVDDDGAVCEILSELLSQAGYDVRCAHDGEEAWADVQRDPPDLILSDIRMPKLGGIDLASRLISGGYRTPIILMSAGHTDRVGVSAAFIRKPFESDHLLAIIARALDTPIPEWVDATA
jgi:CheY-like chemotaxis protein